MKRAYSCPNTPFLPVIKDSIREIHDACVTGQAASLRATRLAFSLFCGNTVRYCTTLQILSLEMRPWTRISDSEMGALWIRRFVSQTRKAQVMLRRRHSRSLSSVCFGPLEAPLLSEHYCLLILRRSTMEDAQIQFAGFPTNSIARHLAAFLLAKVSTPLLLFVYPIRSNGFTSNT